MNNYDQYQNTKTDAIHIVNPDDRIILCGSDGLNTQYVDSNVTPGWVAANDTRDSDLCKSCVRSYKSLLKQQG